MYAMGNLSHGEKRVGVIFGFLQILFRIANRLETNDFVFCWDSDRSFRKLRFKEYKESRGLENKDPEEKENLYLFHQEFLILDLQVNLKLIKVFLLLDNLL